MIHSSANIFSAILNKLWCHVTSEKNFFNKYKFSRIFPFQQYMHYVGKVLVVVE